MLGYGPIPAVQYNMTVLYIEYGLLEYGPISAVQYNITVLYTEYGLLEYMVQFLLYNIISLHYILNMDC